MSRTILAIICWILLPAITSYADRTFVIVVDVFTSGNQEAHAAIEVAKRMTGSREGLKLSICNTQQSKYSEKLKKVAKYFRLREIKLPFTYACNSYINGYSNESTYSLQLKNMLSLTVFSDKDCEPCKLTQPIVDSIRKRYPGLYIEKLSIDKPEDHKLFTRIMNRHHIPEHDHTVPSFYVCNKVYRGSGGLRTAEIDLDEILANWTYSKPNSELLIP
jgi:hypothetical protein